MLPLFISYYSLLLLFLKLLSLLLLLLSLFLLLLSLFLLLLSLLLLSFIEKSNRFHLVIGHLIKLYNILCNLL